MTIDLLRCSDTLRPPVSLNWRFVLVGPKGCYRHAINSRGDAWWRRLRHAAGHEAADRSLTIYKPRPDHRSAVAVRLGDHGVIRNDEPLVVETNAVMAAFGIPVWIGDRVAIRERTAQPFPAREMIEPAI